MMHCKMNDEIVAQVCRLLWPLYWSRLSEKSGRYATGAVIRYPKDDAGTAGVYVCGASLTSASQVSIVPFMAIPLNRDRYDPASSFIAIFGLRELAIHDGRHKSA